MLAVSLQVYTKRILVNTFQYFFLFQVQSSWFQLMTIIDDWNQFQVKNMKSSLLIKWNHNDKLKYEITMYKLIIIISNHNEQNVTKLIEQFRKSISSQPIHKTNQFTKSIKSAKSINSQNQSNQQIQSILKINHIQTKLENSNWTKAKIRKITEATQLTNYSSLQWSIENRKSQCTSWSL